MTIFVLSRYSRACLDRKSEDLVMNLFTGKLMVLKCCCLHRMADLYSLWTKVLNFLMTIFTRFLTSVKLGILYLSFHMTFAYKSKQILVVRADFIAYIPWQRFILKTILLNCDRHSHTLYHSCRTGSLQGNLGGLRVTGSTTSCTLH